MYYDPFEEIAKMHEEMERIFNKLYRGSGGLLEDKTNMNKLARIGEGYRSPAAKVRETETGFLTEIELPGADKNDIQLNVTDNSVEVKVEKNTEEKIDEKGIKGYRASFSKFYRCIPLPSEVDPDKVKARYKNGMLSIELPRLKVIEHKKKNIDIE